MLSIWSAVMWLWGGATVETSNIGCKYSPGKFVGISIAKQPVINQGLSKHACCIFFFFPTSIVLAIGLASYFLQNHASLNHTVVLAVHLLTMYISCLFQIYVISLAEPRLPLQLDDAIRPEVEGEEVKMCFLISNIALKIIFRKRLEILAAVNNTVMLNPECWAIQHYLFPSS